MAETIGGAFEEMSVAALLGAVHAQFPGKKGQPDFGAIAKALGVTRRTPERWYTKGKETRSPSKTHQDKLKRLLKRPARVRVQGEFEKDTPRRDKKGKPIPGSQEQPRQRDILIPPDRDMTPEELANLQDELAVSEENAFEYLFADLYGFLPNRVINPSYTLIVR
jgi:hypothetical protein